MDENTPTESSAPEIVEDASSFAPDPPNPNVRALAAEQGIEYAGQLLQPAPGSIDIAAKGDGMLVRSAEGIELRHVGGRWFRTDTGAELRDQYGNTFTPTLHELREGVPSVNTKNALRMKTGRHMRRIATEHAARANGFDSVSTPTTLPPLVSTIAETATPSTGNRVGETASPPRSRVAESASPNQTPFYGASSPPSPGASPLIGPAPGSRIGSTENNLQAAALAVVIVETVSGTASLALGPHAAATKPERDAMVDAWGVYLRTVDCSYVPPWSVPLLAMAPYAVRVATHPETASKLQPAPAPDPFASSPSPRVADAETRPAAEPFTGTSFAGLD